MEGALSSGKLDISPVLSHEMPLTNFEEAIRLAKSGQANKIIFIP